MSKEGAFDLNRIVDIFSSFLLIAMLLFSPKVVEIIDTNRSKIGYSGENKVAIDQSREFVFDSTSDPLLVEVLHPNLHEGAKWKEVLELKSDFNDVGLNISIRENPANDVSYYLSNDGGPKFYDEYLDFLVLIPGDRLELTLREGTGCTNCASFTFYDIWNFTGNSGSLSIKFSVNVVDWGKNGTSIITTCFIMLILVGIFWSLTKRSIKMKGFE